MSNLSGDQVKRATYPTYKPSGVEWLGDIPAHWNTWKVTHAFERFGSGTTPKSDEAQYYEGDTPWVTTSELRETLIQDTAQKLTSEALRDYPALRVYPPGTLLFAMYGATIGRLGILGIPATVNQACAAFAGPKVLDPTFTYYWLWMRRPILIALSAGGGQPNLNQDELRRIRICAPSLPEQRAIAAFLDRETARIDGLIAKKRRQIELLQEKRAAFISHAVTKGLDPNVKRKDSGIEWLGQIPEHWSMKRLKFVSALQTGLTLGKKYDGNNLVTRPYLRVANVQDGYLDLDTITEVSLPPEDVSRYELRPGDVLMTEGGDFDKLGRGYVWEGQVSGCLHQNHIFAVRPSPHDLRSAFLSAMLTSSHGKNYFTSTSQQTTNLATTNSTKLLSFPIPLPTLDEQDAILDRVRRAANHQQSLVEKVSSSIERLREYRTALISASVTGKIDVREVST